MHPKVYILILNYNSGRESVELYESLKKENSADTHILVIDNKSTEKDIVILKQNIDSQNLILNKILLFRNFFTQKNFLKEFQ